MLLIGKKSTNMFLIKCTLKRQIFNSTVHTYFFSYKSDILKHASLKLVLKIKFCLKDITHVKKSNQNKFYEFHSQIF